MPKLIYNIPTINEKGDFKQKGATCWYYSAKMLLKFHGMTKTDPSSQVYQSYKALSELRKVLTETRDERDRNNQERMTAKLNGLASVLEPKVQKYQADINRLKLDSANKWADVIKELTNKSAPAAARLERLKKAAELLAKADTDGMTRVEIFRAFFPKHSFTVQYINADPKSIKDTYDSLVQFGPLYVSGEMSHVGNPQLKAGTDALYDAVALEANSAHAVVLAGIDTKKAELYYKDPAEGTDKLLVAKFDLFMKHIRKENATTAIVLATRCPELLMNRSCSHIKAQPNISVHEAQA